MQIVVFKLNDEQFALETSKVQGINDMMKVTVVPCAPEYIKGLINLRGSIISLLDIELLLEIDKSNSKKNNIIILNMRDELVGMSVDTVEEVLEVEEGIIEKLDDSKRRPYEKGVINLNDSVVTLIDTDKLLPN